MSMDTGVLPGISKIYSMKNLVIIRTCERDDFLAFHCYNSFKKVGVDADYLFFAQHSYNGYKWITRTGEKIVERGYSDNFGGMIHALSYIQDLKSLDVSGYDRIIISDSDIILHKNPLEVMDEYGFGIGGVQDATNKKHFSGQFQIYSAEVFERCMGYREYESLSIKFISDGINVADDTLLSWIATDHAETLMNFDGTGCWSHEKLYHLENEYTG